MRSWRFYIRFMLVIILIPFCSYAQNSSEEVWDSIDWTQGPSQADLGSIAQVQVPYGYVFADGDDTRKLMELMENIVNYRELGFVAPDNLEWFIVFEFDEIGYVRDDEKDLLDADALLHSLKQGTEEANKIRQQRGWTPLHILDWLQPPRYNPYTNNLEWATRGVADGDLVVNWNTRLLGRRGVMSVVLVADPSLIQAILPDYQKCMDGFSYKFGSRYGDWTTGDPTADVGLTALVVGGATAVAAKTGLLKGLFKMLASLWKLVLVGLVAVGAIIKKIFTRDS